MIAWRLVDVGRHLGVTKQRAHQIAARSGFPHPVAEIIEDGCGMGERSRLGRSGGARRSRGVSRPCHART